MGKTKGCKAMTVFALKDWPVCAWYQKLGFNIEFEYQEHRNGTIGCYLIKKLSNRLKLILNQWFHKKYLMIIYSDHFALRLATNKPYI